MNGDNAGGKVKVLVVEDSAVMRELLVHILRDDPDIQVIGTATNGEEAVEAVTRKRPDVIAMDFHMPRMNGLDATRKIMETCPTPIVLVSGSSMRDEAAAAFHAIEAGALTVVGKPVGVGHEGHERTADEFVQTVKLMSEVRVVRRWARNSAAVSGVAPRWDVEPRPVAAEIKLVAIGASTGGPMVLKTILSGLRKNFPVPVLIVQHISPGFTEGFVEWLARSTDFPVQTAAHGERLLPGHAYVAPDGMQMKVGPGGETIVLARDEAEHGHRPSVSYLFRSVAAVFGRNAAGVLLTGMGRDGADELRLMKERGAVTIAQNKETSVVHGMPGEAVNLDATIYVLPPDKIAITLGSLVK